MRIFLSMALILIGFLTNAQTPGWTPLDLSVGQPNLENNPLKGIASNFPTEGTWNQFPYSISNTTFTYGELVNDDQSINFALIDTLLNKEANLGNFTMIQVNVDNGRIGGVINPLDGTGAVKDLPAFLDNVNRLYYLGDEVQIAGNDLVNNVFNLDPADDTGDPSMVVDYNDPELIAALVNLIEALGQRYDEDDRLFIVHFGIYGIYGEFNLGAGKVYIDDLVDANGNNLGLTAEDWEMTVENQSILVDAYQEAFTKTRLVARNAEIPNAQTFGFSDGLYFGGSISETNGFFFLPGLKKFNADQNWKSQVIGGEMDPFLQASIWTNSPLDATSPTPFENIAPLGDPDRVDQEPQNIEDVIEQTHPTFIFQNYMVQEFNVGNFGATHDTPDPLNSEKNPFAGQDNTNFWNNALLATKKLGYTFHIDEFNLSAQAGNPAVEVNIRNTGVAPIYADWDVEFAYLDTKGTATTDDDEPVSLGTTSNWNLSKILPDVIEGQAIEANEENKRTFISEELLDASTEYTFLIRIINPLERAQPGIRIAYPQNAKPVRFDNATQDENLEGWLTLGSATTDANREFGVFPAIATSLTPVGSTNIVMSLQSEEQLSVEILPSNIPFEWKSSSPFIADVDPNGIVTSFVTAGEVIITAFTPDGQEAAFLVTVRPYFVIPDRIEAEDYSALGLADMDPFNDVKEVTITSGGDIGEIAIDNLQDNDTLKYFVTVEEGGADFILKFRAKGKSGPADARVRILDGSNNPITGDVAFGDGVPNGTFSTAVSDTFDLEAGDQVINIIIARSNFDLNWIEFEKIDFCDGFDLSLIGQPCTNLPIGFENGIYTDRCKCEGTPINQLIADGVYTIKSETNDFIVTTTSGEFVNSQTTEDGNKTKWEFTHLGNNVYTIGSVEFPGELLGVTFGGCGAFQAVGLTASPDASLARFQWQAAEVNGKFVFNTVGCTGFSLDIFSANPTTVHLFDTNNAENAQLFNLIPEVPTVNQLIADGVYTIKSETNDFIVTTTSGEFVNSQTTEDGNKTKWEFTHLGNNVYTIGSVEFPGELLGVTFGGCGAFQAVGLTASPDASLPRFQWQAAEVNGKFVFNTVGCTGFSLDIFSANPTTVHLFDTNNAENAQLFNLIPEVPTVNQLIADGVYTIKSETNDFIVTTTSGEFVNSQTTEDGNKTKWEFTHLGNNVYTIGSVEFPGELLGVTFGGCGAFQAVGLTASPDASLPRFQWQAAEVNGKFVFNTVGCTGFSLDIFSANPTTVHLFDTNNAENAQLFNLILELPDTEAPIALCNNLTISIVPGEVASITAAQLDGGSTDNEGIASISIDQNTFDIDDLGVNDVTLTVVDNSGNVATCIASLTVEETVLSVTKFFLVDAESNLDIQEIADGDVIDLATVPSVNFNIRAETTDDVESVRLELNGPVSNTRTENVAPYAAFGDSNSNYNGEVYETGVYDISADPYSANNLQGDLGTALSISFEFTGTPNILSVQRFFLVDADSDLDIQEIVEGDIIDLTSLPSTNLDIRAEATNDVESVRLKLTGPVSNTRTENFAPYALFGDSNGDYNGNSNLPVGAYNINAKPFSQNALGGTEGFSLGINFTLTTSAVGFVVDNEILIEDAKMTKSNSSSDLNTEMDDSDLVTDKPLATEKLSVWPNPFQDNITLKLNHDRAYKRVFIQDLKGVVLANVELEGRVGGENINIQVNGPAGMYLMYVETNDGIEVEKIVKF